MQHRPDNYQIMARQAQQLFLTYDQSAIIEKSPVTYDENYLYLPVLDQVFRIDRKSGDLCWSVPNGSYVPSTAASDRLTIFDYLCDAKKDRCLSGSWLSMANFGQLFHAGLLEESNPSELEKCIDLHPDRFHSACQKLHATPFPNCDIGYKLSFFPDMPLVLQFWHSDDEFPAQLRFFWDKNALSYLRYETMYYAVGILQNRLLALMNP